MEASASIFSHLFLHSISCLNSRFLHRFCETILYYARASIISPDCIQYIFISSEYTQDSIISPLLVRFVSTLYAAIGVWFGVCVD